MPKLYRKTDDENYKTQLSNYLSDDKISKHNKDILQRFIRDADLDKFNRPLSAKRRAKYITTFRQLERWFDGEPLESITASDFETWYLDLKNDKILNDGKPYSANSKACYVVLIKALWKWLKGDNEMFPVEVKHFRAAWQDKPLKNIPKRDVERLAHSFNKFEYTFATLFLFDSGFRREEFFSMKIRNLTVQTREGGEDYYLAECEQSKTTPRKVAVALYPETYNRFVKEFCSHKKKDEPLASFSYEAYRKALNEASVKVLGTPLTPHDLRKASATHFAGVLKNPYRVNKKYGWAMTSDVGNIYINAAGIPEEEAVELVEHNQVADLKKDNEKLRKQFTALQEQVAVLVATRYSARKSKS